MKILLMGPPGGGKGTQAKLLCEHYHIPHISTGDLLRAAMQEDTANGRDLKALMGTGNLIADDIVLDLLSRRLQQDDCQAGYLLDGFPRNLEQVFAMNALGIDVEHVVNIEVPFDAIVERMAGRRFHIASGRSYHTLFNPPKHQGLDDVTGERLIQRKDDHPDVVQHRTNSAIDGLLRRAVSTRSRALRRREWSGRCCGRLCPHLGCIAREPIPCGEIG